MNKETYFIDGKPYVAVDRKAQLGDKVVITEKLKRLDVGHVGEITHMYNEVLPIVDENHFVFLGEMRVLEPASECETDAKVLELLANLSRRVHSLERQLTATQGNVEKLAQELATALHATKLIEGEFDALKKVGVRPW